MNKPFTPKQTCRFFVLFYALFSAFFIYSYMVNEPISGPFLLMLPTIQIIKSYQTAEEKRYFIIQAIFALFAMTLTYSVGIWLGHVKPLILILPAGFAVAILYRIYFKGTIYLFTPDTICSISTTSKKTTSKLGNRLFFYLDYQ
ncbi:TPA: MFS transporter [Streptococcus suis]|uniref:MFS transporter n=1 Tax=Streptococcus suis TaxID=1307 RepID=UPI00209C3ADC|nr:MFS transporter [Streptococcus suis]MCO8178400.1 MFS transporter [Streptococcus suis]